MSILILAHAGDRLALQVAARLRRRLPSGRLRILSPEELVFAGWEHRVSGDGCETEIRVHDGSVLAGRVPCVTWCRLHALNLPHFAAATRADRDYSAMEWFALVLSFLAGRGRVVNPVTPQGLSGPCLSPLGWSLMAARAGLTAARSGSATSRRRFPPRRGWTRVESPLLRNPAGADVNGLAVQDPPWACSEPLGKECVRGTVVGDRVLGDLPEDLEAGCLRLARLAGLDILACHFRKAAAASGSGRKGWLFARACPFPLEGDPVLVSAIADFLAGQSGNPCLDPSGDCPQRQPPEAVFSADGRP